MFALQALLPRLPLVLPVEATLPPSPKVRYRSQYRYPEPDALLEKEDWEGFSDFEIALRLIDFSPLEQVLAQKYKPSRKGQVPFHPVSLFLCVCLRRELHCSWRKLASILKGSHGTTWRALFGFPDGDTPSASGLRYFFQTVGASFFDELCPRFIDLLHQQGLLPARSTYPTDPPGLGVTITKDGMLHQARHRACCRWAEDSCYQPLTGTAPQEPTPAVPAGPHPEDGEESATATPNGSESASSTRRTACPKEEDETPSPPSGRRPCRAREKGRLGCDCDSPACQEQQPNGGSWPETDGRLWHRTRQQGGEDRRLPDQPAHLGPARTPGYPAEPKAEHYLA